MTIQLRPELEEFIPQDIERGLFQTVDEFLEHAIHLLHNLKLEPSSDKNYVDWLLAQNGRVSRNLDLDF